jgi:hypothetical protein
MNPFRVAHEWIWHALEGDPEFVRLVAPRSRVKAYTYVVPETMIAPAEADLPRVLVGITKLDFQIPAATNAVVFRMDWTIEVQVGGQNLDMASDLVWAIVRALNRVVDSQLPAPLLRVTIGGTTVTPSRVSERVASLVACTVQVDCVLQPATIQTIPSGGMPQ